MANYEIPRFHDFSKRPMMLKDFLTQDYYYSCTSSSKSTDSSESNQPPPPAVALLRSWSKKAAAATKISAIRKVINAVKLLQRNPRKSAKGKNDITGETVKVKDILRLMSFRDAAEDESTSPDRTVTTASSSSWCDSDFTAEDLPFWSGEKCFNAAALLRNTKLDWSVGECEQQSPVSVLDLPPFPARRIRGIDGAITKSKQTRKHSLRGEMSAIEEKAAQLLISHVEQVSKFQQDNDHMIMNTMVYDFFRHELSLSEKLNDFELDDEVLRVAKSWCNGETDNESYEWDVKEKREAYVKDMEKGVCWNKFKQEEEDMSLELEVEVLDELIDEFLVDFLTK